MNWLAPLDIGLAMGLVFAWAVLALALAFRLLNFPDLTVEGSFPIGAAVYAVLVRGGASVPLAMGCAFCGGAVAGAMTGFLHVRFQLNKFLAGIIVVAMSYSISLRIMGASNIGLLRQPSLFTCLTPLSEVTWGHFHVGLLLVLGGLLAVGGVLIALGLGTRAGTRLRAAGCNPEFARSLGISVPLSFVIGLALTNGLSAFAGTLLAMHQGFADISMGQGTLILALAAMTIGERVVPEKRLPLHVFVIVAAIVGSVVYQLIVAYAVRLGVPATDLKLATAVLVLIIVAFRVSKDGELLSGDVQ